MIIIAGGEAAYCCRINRLSIGAGGRHDKQVVVGIKEAAAIYTVPDAVDDAGAQSFFLFALFPLVRIKLFTSHQHIFFVRKSCDRRKGNPASIGRPGSFTDTAQHVRQLTRFAALSIDQPELVLVFLAVGEEEQVLAIGSPNRICVVFDAAGQLARFTRGATLLV